MRTSLFTFGVALGLAAQMQEITFTASPPPPVGVTAVTVSRSGPGSTRTSYYWIVANYPVGNAVPAGPVIASSTPAVYSGTNYVTLRWPAMSGATSYDILRTATPTLPTSAVCVCAKATGVTATTYIDNNETLTNYTITSAGMARQTLTMVNKDRNYPYLDLQGNYKIGGMYWPRVAGTKGQALVTDGVDQLSFATPGTGNVLGPGTGLNTNNYIPQWDGLNTLRLKDGIDPITLARRNASNAFNTGTQDFSGATATLPMKTGAALPLVCTTGEFFYLTSALAGNNLYACTSANIWTQLSAIGAFSGTHASNTVWTVAGATHQLGTCDLAVVTYTATAGVNTEVKGVVACDTNAGPTQYNVTITFGLAVGGRYVLIKGGGASGGGGGGGLADPGGDGIVTRIALNTTTFRTLTGTAGEIAILNGTGVAGNPTFSIATAFDLSGKTSTIPWPTGLATPPTCAVGMSFFDTNAPAGRNLYGCTAPNVWTLLGDGGGGGSYTAGPGIDAVQLAGGVIGIDTALVPMYLTGSTSIDFGSINHAACAESAFTLAGALPGDGIAPRWPSTLEAGLIGIIRVSAADTVAVRLCNFSGAPLNPANQTFGVTIVRVP